MPHKQSPSEIYIFFQKFKPLMSSCAREARDTLFEKIIVPPYAEDFLYETVDEFTNFWLETDWFKEPETEKSSDECFKQMWEELYGFRLLVFAHYDFMHPALRPFECDICDVNDEFVRFRNKMVWERKQERLESNAQTTVIPRPPTPPIRSTAIRHHRGSLSIRRLVRRIRTRLHLASASESHPNRDVFLHNQRPTIKKIEDYKSLDAKYCEAYFSVIESFERKQGEIDAEQKLVKDNNASCPNPDLDEMESSLNCDSEVTVLTWNPYPDEDELSPISTEILAARLNMMQRQDRHLQRLQSRAQSTLRHSTSADLTQWLEGLLHNPATFNEQDDETSSVISFDAIINALYMPAREFLQLQES